MFFLLLTRGGALDLVMWLRAVVLIMLLFSVLRLRERRVTNCLLVSSGTAVGGLDGITNRRWWNDDDQQNAKVWWI